MCPTRWPGWNWRGRIGDAAGFYKIGLGMLTGGGLALANELKQEHGKRIFLDMKLFDIGATVEAAVRGLAQYDLDFLTVHGDPQVVRAAAEGGAGGAEDSGGDGADLAGPGRSGCQLIRAGDLAEITLERAARALEAGADGVIASPQEAARSARLPQAGGQADRDPRRAPGRGGGWATRKRMATPAQAVADGADHIVVGGRSGRPPTRAPPFWRSTPNWPAHRRDAVLWPPPHPIATPGGAGGSAPRTPQSRTGPQGTVRAREPMENPGVISDRCCGQRPSWSPVSG
jgi:orotidine-5'-phosphate decarboxylase